MAIELKALNKNQVAHVKPGKAPYRAPVLRTYGAVAQLTAGGAGSLVDKKSQRKK